MGRGNEQYLGAECGQKSVGTAKIIDPPDLAIRTRLASRMVWIFRWVAGEYFDLV